MQTKPQPKLITPCPVCGGKLFVNGQCLRCVQRIELTEKQSAQFNKPLKTAMTNPAPSGARHQREIMKYLFYIEGLEREAWSKGESRKAAQQALWDSLSDDERDRVVQIECIDEEPDK